MSAFDGYGSALLLSCHLEERRQEALVLNVLRVSYVALGHHAVSIERYLAALEIWQALGRDDQMASVLERLRAAQAATGR